MNKLIVLELEGNFETARFCITLEIRAEQEFQVLKVKGYLPPAPEVAQQVQHHWQYAYRSLGMPLRIKEQKIIHKGSLNQCIADCREFALVLRDRFRSWLNAESFQLVDRRLHEALNREDRIRFLIRTGDLNLQKLPWHEWNFFEHYLKAEVALNAPEQEIIDHRNITAVKKPVEILAILGNSCGIHLENDCQIL